MENLQQYKFLENLSISLMNVSELPMERDNTFTNITSNSTLSFKLKKVTPVSTALQFTFGVVGNLLAIFVLFRSAKKHKWRIFYRLVGALAATDLFGIVATSPVALIVYANNLRWVGGQPLCDYLSFMLIFAGLATVFIVGAMSFDRFLAVWFPYFYNASMQKRRINVMLAGLWAIAIFIACFPLMGIGHNVLHFPGTWCFFDFFGTELTDKFFSYMYASIGIFVIGLTAVLNILVIVMLAKSNRNEFRRKNSVSSTRGGRSRRNDVFIMIFLVVLLVVFGTCWTPLMVRVMINQSGAFAKNVRADILAVRLASINQILDPWVYILLRKDFIVRIINFGKKHTKPGSLFHRLSSRTSSRSGSQRQGSETDPFDQSSVTLNNCKLQETLNETMMNDVIANKIT